MATQVLTTARFWIGDKRIDTDLTTMRAEWGAEPQDDTVFNDATRSSAGGLKTVRVSADGLWSGGDGNVDDDFFDNLGGVDTPWTGTPNAAADGDAAYLTRVMRASYGIGAPVGEFLTITGGFEGRDVPLVRGQMLRNSAETATGSGAAVQVGAIASGQTGYGILHVTAHSVTDITMRIQSDNASGFGTPTTRITFSTLTGTGSGWGTIAGPITDDWWRADWTITGAGSVTLAVAFGIL